MLKRPQIGEEMERISAAALAGLPTRGPLAENWVHSACDADPPDDGWQPPTEFPLSFDPEDREHLTAPEAPTLVTTTPSDWSGDIPEKEWLARGRIPAGDVTILGADGGTGKTEIAEQLHIAVSHEMGDWLGCVVESGTSLFVSAEEPEDDIRGRRARILKRRGIDGPVACSREHYLFPPLDDAWFVITDRTGALRPTRLFQSLDRWIRENRPRLVIVDAIVAVFGCETNFQRQQVRTFVAMLRKTARETGAAILLLDHPSVRGLSDGSGTTGSVDWNNAVRSRLFLSLDKDDPDVRHLEVKKANYSRAGEKVSLRWDGLTFAPEGTVASPHRAAADRQVDETFLRLLDKHSAQGRRVRPGKGRGYAPAEFEQDPDAGGIKARAFHAAMERLFDAAAIRAVTVGPPSRRTTHIERVVA